VNKSFVEGAELVIEDQHFWKAKLEQLYESIEPIVWMDIQWSYVYSLFHDVPKDKLNSVAIEHIYDVRIVKIAYDLGADYSKGMDVSDEELHIAMGYIERKRKNKLDPAVSIHYVQSTQTT
jgi:hypothetical protein